MIKAFVFDLDGTLVQTEILKAHSYAKAVVKLKQGKIKEHEVIDAYKKLVGRSREEVAKSLIEEFQIEKESENLLNDSDAKEPWEAFVKVRLNYYFDFLDNPRIIKTVSCPFSTELLKKVKSENYKTALATTSHFDEASRVLEVLKLKNLFDFIATRDLIKNSKPDPEIYNLAMSELKVKPEESIAIEDSLTGIKAATAAKLNCIAVTNDYTREDVNKSNLLDSKWIINDFTKLNYVVEEMKKNNS